MHALLDSTTLRILHAHQFARASPAALAVLTDLLARYLQTSIEASAQYAHLAGRAGLVPHDAFAALDDLGVHIDDLAASALDTPDYARRADDMAELRAYLADGRPSRGTPIPLVWAQYNSDDDDSDDDDVYVQLHPPRSYTPDHLPPLPSDHPHPLPMDIDAPPIPTDTPIKPERAPSPILPFHPPPATTTTTSSSDYLAQIPYAHSALASVAHWHLPQPPPDLAFAAMNLGSGSGLTVNTNANANAKVNPTPQVAPALLAAYHHILTNPAPPAPGPTTKHRHRVALALLPANPLLPTASAIGGGLGHTTPRWDAPDSLFAHAAPCAPRANPAAPTFPVPLEDAPGASASGKPPAKSAHAPPLPPAPPRPVFGPDRPVYLPSNQGSRVAELARVVLAPSVHTRTTRLAHPPVLTRPAASGSA
ncbi:hypothetical protein BJ138DRAFT_1179296, partial [Hygrophoropsis aurantiaca]